MRQGTFLRLFAVLCLLSAAGIALPACGGGSTGGSEGGTGIKSGEQDLYLKKFLLVDQNLNPIGGTGTTNAFRDVRLLFVFNTKVDFSSVNTRAIRIGIPTGTNLFLEATGKFRPVEGRPNQVLFDPTFTKGNLTATADNPLGLDADAIYEVNIASATEANKVITNADGDGIVKGFTASFHTTDEYLQNLKQPELDATDPDDGETDVNASADVVFRFTEPMKPSSFVLGSTVIVRNLDLAQNVLGTLRFSADLKEVIFRPVFGYGKGPYRIFARVTQDATNLSGNKLPKEVRFTFTTIFDPTRPEFGQIKEDFETNNYEDKSFGATLPLAAWNQGVTSGFLSGMFTTGTLTLSQGSTTYLWAPWAWGNNWTSQFQVMFKSTEMGGSRTITGFNWYHRTLQSATVANVTIKMGHTQLGTLSTTYPANYSDTPVSVVNNLNSYTLNNVPTENWRAGPTYTSNWKYNGTDNIILEVNCTCGTLGWSTTWTGLWRVVTNDQLTRMAYNVPPAAGGGNVTRNYFVDTQFSFLIDQAEAQSKFYDTGIKSPQYLDVVLFPDTASQPAGTSSIFTFQGAPDDPENVGTPDLDMVTDWETDLTRLSGYRHVRFHFLGKGNQSTVQIPMYDDLILPFIFF